MGQLYAILCLQTKATLSKFEDEGNILAAPRDSTLFIFMSFFVGLGNGYILLYDILIYIF